MNAYAMWNHYGNRTNGSRVLHVFSNRAERDRWVSEDVWSEDVGDYQRETVTMAEAERARDRIAAVWSHGEVTVPKRLASICEHVRPCYPFPDPAI